ncbi:MAG: hypothetical protein GF317_13595 [Candidatus Lokiarchaeota archaeon]|nr:hypothetical protein [Candidatus Lokiarchaeota archaeon]MBD3200674.1 hypothetical protein [Candidatus Lokiarchaeota archaeon]
MNEKNNDLEADKLQKLILFDDSNVSESQALSEQTKVSEEIDQKDNIKLLNELKPIGGKFQYNATISNESLALIKEVNIKIEYPNFLELNRSIPPTLTIVPPRITEEDEEITTTQVKIEFDKIPEGQLKKISLFFNPLQSNEEGEIRTFAAFVNVDDYIRVINSEPMMINLKQTNIQPQIIPSSQIADFLKQAEIKKSIRSIGIGKEEKLDYEFIFNRLEVILRANNFQFIAKDKKKQIIWYFGEDLESNTDILVIGQVKSNKIEWITVSENPLLNISLLTQFSNELEENLVRLGIINSDDQLFILDCKACGYVLPKFPKKGKSVECKKCGVDQTIW